jgi:lipopolysaccharide heptosyltransferase II/tetraacyldisaccharide 4'-kinase
MFPGEHQYLRFFQGIDQWAPGGGGLVHGLLQVASPLYQVGARARRGLYQRSWLPTKHLPPPVVSVGNLTVGGTGKTPLTAYLARFFQGRQKRVAILSRGYGGRRTEVTCLSDGERLYHKPPEVGEEAFWLAQSLPGVLVYTGPCRYAAGMAAWRDHRPDIFLLDDGFQHFQVVRDLDLVLLDADRPFGNGRLLPAGPLREPLNTLREADVLILTRYDQKRHRDRLRDLRRTFPHLDIFTAAIESASVRRFPGGEEHPPESLRGLPALAFAGLARPRVFEKTLMALGADLRGFRTFPDHFAFAPEDLADLIREAHNRGAQALITTTKDWARLGEAWQGDFPLWVLEVAARVEPEDGFRQCLSAALEQTLAYPALPLPGPRDSELQVTRPVPPPVRRRFQKLVSSGKSLIKPHNVHRIIFRAPNWVGDAVMSLPVLAGLTCLWPAAQVTILAAPRVAPLFSGQPGVTDVLTYPAGKEKWRLLWGLRGRFDLALALPNSFEAALGLWLTRTPHRLGYAANGRAPLLTTVLRGRRRLQGLHQVFYYLGLLQAFGPVQDFSPPCLRLSETERDEGRRLLTEGGQNPKGPWIGLAPGATYGPAKRWPYERFAAVGDLLQEELQTGVVLLGGPGDREAALEVQRQGRGKFLNLAGKTTLRQALMVLSHMQVLITNDSGLMHAAAALQVPVVAIFGSTDSVATGPFTNRATIIHHHLPCSPCLERTCALGYPCLTEITVAEVAEAARGWLKQS